MSGSWQRKKGVAAAVGYEFGDKDRRIRDLLCVIWCFVCRVRRERDEAYVIERKDK